MSQSCAAIILFWFLGTRSRWFHSRRFVNVIVWTKIAYYQKLIITEIYYSISTIFSVFCVILTRPCVHLKPYTLYHHGAILFLVQYIFSFFFQMQYQRPYKGIKEGGVSDFFATKYMHRLPTHFWESASRSRYANTFQISTWWC